MAEFNEHLQFNEKIKEKALALRQALLEEAVLFDVVYLGMGSVEAHARARTLEEWIIAWGTAQNIEPRPKRKRDGG